MKPNELKAELQRKNLNYQDAAKALGISVVAFQRKVNAITEFKSSEIGALRDLLELSPERVTEIFFN
ncbi:toxin-antitoxin system, antitoxin component, Xre family protein [Proteiniclasticum sp. BAD-10]|uniref:Toxin-antitoxin system, antitoxin component, Xre family protein n=1 Tax=Proteiniclasticum sediminis TaxID=2804028 RepID=A0A941CQ39_9CLOT|nr:toxin-antitoxin system, antitoxin component, Xre family protein [Proteiniclasticum sediminis]MBR0575723.1 toxin-antitoxin system, antitoxin component, Xre family protein [Proteiniclasticum sediminis]